MKKVFGFLSVVFVLVLGCQREVDEILDDEEPPMPIDTAAMRVKTTYEIDSISPTEEDTIYITHFTYDEQRRLVKTSQESQVDSAIIVNRFFYQGNSRNAYLVTYYSYEDYDDRFLDSTFLFYANNLVIRDSMIRYSSIPSQDANMHYEGYQVARFTANSPSSVSVHYTRRAAGAFPGGSSFTDTEENGNVNILQNSDQVYEQICDNSLVLDNSYLKNIYSSVFNPYYGLMPVGLADTYDGLFGVASSKKYLPGQVHLSPVDTDYQFSVAAELNAEGFPVKLSIYSGNPGYAPDISRLRYE